MYDLPRTRAPTKGRLILLVDHLCQSKIVRLHLHGLKLFCNLHLSNIVNMLMMIVIITNETNYKPNIII